jgi:hypothetical protein
MAPHHPRLGAGVSRDLAPIQGRPGTVAALEAILSRSMVPILRQMEDKQPELVMALLPSLVRTMLAAFVEVMAEQR